MENKVIEIKNLDYSYPDGTRALSDVSLDIMEGDSIGIIGPNGAGKSTLLLHLNGILRGNNHIKIFGLAVDESNLARIRSKIGLVFQDPDSQLFMPTVFEDVAFGPINMDMSKDEVQKSVQEALKKVDMSAAVNRVSHHLSFGEKKRISIATVLSMNPGILVLDEPSSNLDPRHRRQLINMLKDFKMTKLIATHDLDLVLELCSKVALFDAGKIVAEGKTIAIMKDKALLEAHSLELPPSLAKL